MALRDEVDLDFFDIRAYLEDRGIGYISEGKNVSSGWIGTNCVFCPDKSNHLGINLQSLSISCWKCGRRGNVLSLVMAIDGISFNRAKDIITKFPLKEFSHLVRPKRTAAEKTMFPSGTSEILLPIHEKFLVSRGYDPVIIQHKYDIIGVGPTLDSWKFRIIIPVYMNQILQTYVGRDTTGKAEVKYQNAPVEKSLLQAKHCLQGIDQVTDTIILVEGLLDYWRIGAPAVCCFGTAITSPQIALLANRGIKNCYVLWDNDATDKAHKLAATLTSVIPNVEVLELSTGDPDNLSEDDVWNLRRDIGV
jgi:DNA primase